MSRIVWLASYPKSGNTWLRALLTNYRHDGAGPADINALDGGSHGLARGAIDDCLGIESGLLSLHQLQRYRPRVYEHLASESTDAPLLIKVHDAYRTGADEPSPFDTPAAAGVVYLARHPGDVAVSYAHHRCKSIDDTIEVMANDEAFMDGTAAPGTTIPECVSSWSNHVGGWLDQTAIPVELITYEDLSRDTQGTLARVVRFLGWPEDPARIARATARSSFSELQSQEAHKGFREKQPTAASFFRKGESRNWTASLSPSQIERITTTQSRGLARLSPAI